MKSENTRSHAKQSLPISLQVLLGLLLLGLLIQLYMLRESVVGAVLHWYGQVGVAIFGLLPLTVFFFFIVGHVIFSPEERRVRWVYISLNVVSMAAPLLGMLGTVLGMSEGASQFTLDQGVEHLLSIVSGLMQSLSVVLLSTAWGILLALPSLLMHMVLFPESNHELSHHVDGIGKEAALKKETVDGTRGCHHAKQSNANISDLLPDRSGHDSIGGSVRNTIDNASCGEVAAEDSSSL